MRAASTSVALCYACRGCRGPHPPMPRLCTRRESDHATRHHAAQHGRGVLAGDDASLRGAGRADGVGELVGVDHIAIPPEDSEGSEGRYACGLGSACWCCRTVPRCRRRSRSRPLMVECLANSTSRASNTASTRRPNSSAVTTSHRHPKWCSATLCWVEPSGRNRGTGAPLASSSPISSGSNVQLRMALFSAVTDDAQLELRAGSAPSSKAAASSTSRCWTELRGTLHGVCFARFGIANTHCRKANSLTKTTVRLQRTLRQERCAINHIAPEALPEDMKCSW